MSEAHTIRTRLACLLMNFLGFLDHSKSPHLLVRFGQKLIRQCESPTTRTEFEAFRNASSKVIQSWKDLSQPRGILEFLGTKEVVQDFDSIRSALCYDKINFIGAS
jgi:hypothetical protein